jgi:adenylate cyclase
MSIRNLNPVRFLQRHEVSILLATLTFLLAMWLTGTRDALNRAIVDRHFRWAAYFHPVSFPHELLVVAVDDRTPIGPTRQEFAAVIQHLSKARTIALDYLFDTRPGDSSGDKVLAEAVHAQGKVILPLYRYGALRPVHSRTQEELDHFLQVFPQSDLGPAPFATLNELLLQTPYPALRDSAAGFGFADTNAERDNIFRQPILVRYVTPTDTLIPHFSLAIIAAAQRIPLQTLLHTAPKTLSLGKTDLPLMNEGSYLLRPFVRRPGTPPPSWFDAIFGDEPTGTVIPTVSFADVGGKQPDVFQDKIVLIGETRTGTSDIRPIATDNGLRGVELTAQIIANLLRGDHLQFVPLPVHVLLFLISFLPLYFYNRASLRFATIASLLTLLGLLVVLEILFWCCGWIPDSATLLGTWFASTLFSGQQRATLEYHRREKLRDEVAAYVSTEVADELLQRGSAHWEKPRRQQMAILFADIRNFTPYTEANPPELVQQQLTEFLGEMTEAVFARRGFVDKFVGDAIMVLFDPFHPREKPAIEAVLCALEMLTRLDRLNTHWTAVGLPTFRIGIGIHVGEVLFGNMSSGRRKTLTAIGDNVNLASRIESATKEYGVPLLVSEQVRQEVEEILSDRVRFVDLGAFTARGRHEATHLFAINRHSDPEQH